MVKLSFSEQQLKKLSDIFSNLGLLSAGSIIVPVLVETFNPLLFIAGTLVSILFWVLSLWLLK